MLETSLQNRNILRRISCPNHSKCYYLALFNMTFLTAWHWCSPKCIYWDRVSCSTGWYISEDNFKLLVLLLLLSKCWNHGCAPPLPVYAVLEPMGLEPMALGSLGKYSTSLTIFPGLSSIIYFSIVWSIELLSPNVGMHKHHFSLFIWMMHSPSPKVWPMNHCFNKLAKWYLMLSFIS